jgi:hypothetical protein
MPTNEWRPFAHSLAVRVAGISHHMTPVGKYFVTYEGLPADWYLKLTGAATQMMRGAAPLSERIPEHLPFPKEGMMRIRRPAGNRLSWARRSAQFSVCRSRTSW